MMLDPAHRPARALLLLLASLAAVLAVPQAATATVPYHSRTSYERGIGLAIQRQINGERRAHHLAPVTMSSQLMLSARRHDVTMARDNTMSHQLPHEAFFGTRIKTAGYHWTWAGENIAWNSRMSTAGVAQVQSLMYNEKAPDNGHRLNILNGHFRNVGVDVYFDETHHKVWLTTDFGRT